MRNKSAVKHGINCWNWPKVYLDMVGLMILIAPQLGAFSRLEHSGPSRSIHPSKPLVIDFFAWFYVVRYRICSFHIIWPLSLTSNSRTEIMTLAEECVIDTIHLEMRTPVSWWRRPVPRGRQIRHSPRTKIEFRLVQLKHVTRQNLVRK